MKVDRLDIGVGWLLAVTLLALVLSAASARGAAAYAAAFFAVQRLQSESLAMGRARPGPVSAVVQTSAVSDPDALLRTSRRH